MTSYDVFLSHNGVDKPQVETIARLLEKKGLRPFLDKWHLIPGEPWQEGLEAALDLSQSCAIFLGASGIGPWENEEMRSALEERARNPHFRVIPVLLPGTARGDPSGLPRFLRRLTWVKFRSGPDDDEALRGLVAGIRGHAPHRGLELESSSAFHLQKGIIHPLPPAPSFTGRQGEMGALKKFWVDDAQTTVALIGLGGAGKTALAARFISMIISGELPPPDKLFVWSFYNDQDPNSFLHLAYRHFSDGDEARVSGPALLYRLTELLSGGGRHLIVMDGLERVQRPPDNSKGAFGEIEDPLLRQVLSRLCFGTGRTKCLITSRFPVADLYHWRGASYRPIDVTRLEPDDARLLLRRHKVKGDDVVLDRLLTEYGSHALTVDHLGIYLAEFCGGDPMRASELEHPVIDSDMPEERRLARVLRAYENALSPVELDLLSRLCIFRFGTTVEALHSIFSTESPSGGPLSGSLTGMAQQAFYRSISRLTQLHLVIQESPDRFSAHPAVRDHFYRLFTDVATMHGAVGSTYRRIVGLDVLEEWEKIESSIKAWEAGRRAVIALKNTRERFRRMTTGPVQFRGIANLWLKGDLWGARRLAFSLSAVDQVRFVTHLAGEPLTDGRVSDFQFFESGTFNKMEARDEWEILFSPQVHEGSFSEREVRTKLFAEGRQLAENLRGMIGRYERDLPTDTQSRLLKCAECLACGCEVIVPRLGMHHTGLALRPGASYPDDRPTLEFLEELIYHSVAAGNEREGYSIYKARLGGFHHLGERVGEFARGARILRYFPKCPNEWDLAWYLRGVGELREAVAILMRIHPRWAGPVLCAQGFLPRIFRERFIWRQTKMIAEFLTGLTSGVVVRSDFGWGEAFLGAELYLLAGDVQAAGRVAALSEGHHRMDRIRADLVAAEVERRSGNITTAGERLEKAATWVLHSNSVEHLCLFHLVRTRLLADEERLVEACSLAAEGMHLALRCGLGLYHVDFANLQARLLLRRYEREGAPGPLLLDAELCARHALYGTLRNGGGPAPGPDVSCDDLLALGALHPECNYIWGAIEALSSLGEVMLARGDGSGAYATLERALKLQMKVHHPNTSRTRDLLLSACSATEHLPTCQTAEHSD